MIQQIDASMRLVGDVLVVTLETVEIVGIIESVVKTFEIVAVTHKAELKHI